MENIRICVLDVHKISPDLRWAELDDETFANLSEAQGNNMSLKTYQELYNSNRLDNIFIHTVIRFIEQ